MIRLSVITEAFVQAMESIRSDPARACGVMVGVVVATGALTLLSGIAASGRQALVSATAGDEEASLIEIAPGAAPGDRMAANVRPLDRFDAGIVGKSASLRGTRVGSRRSTVALATWPGKSGSLRVLGVSPKVPSVLGLKAARGRLLEAADEVLARRVVLLGSAIAEKILKEHARPGMSLTLAGSPFRIVGVLAPAPSFSSGDPWDWDSSVIVSDAALQAILPGRTDAAATVNVDKLFLGVPSASEARVGDMRDLARSLLIHRRRGLENFQLDAGEDRVARLGMVLGIVSALLLATAGIALLVSSLNVMNATIISAAERSREIGVRRSLGATRVDVFLQFVIEATALSLVGAAVGVALGLMLVLGLGGLIKLAMPSWEMQLIAWGPPAAARFRGRECGVCGLSRLARSRPGAGGGAGTGLIVPQREGRTPCVAAMPRVSPTQTCALWVWHRVRATAG